MNRLVSISLLAMLLATGCARKTVVITSDDASNEQFAVPDLDFNYFSARSRIEYSDGSQEVKGKMSIRMKKDSLIWISIYGSALNIEAMRCLMTTDSIYVLDQINNTYYQYDYPTLSKRINFTVDFELAQNMIVGNMPRKKRRQDKFSRGQDHFLIKQADDFTFIDNYFGSISNKLEKVKIVQEGNRSSVVLSYGDFNATEGKNAVFAYSSNLNIEFKDKDKTYYTMLKIKHSKAELSDEPLSFPFKMPNK
jgi:hypothetical protein